MLALGIFGVIGLIALGFVSYKFAYLARFRQSPERTKSQAFVHNLLCSLGLVCAISVISLLVVLTGWPVFGILVFFALPPYGVGALAEEWFTRNKDEIPAIQA